MDILFVSDFLNKRIIIELKASEISCEKGILDRSSQIYSKECSQEPAWYSLASKSQVCKNVDFLDSFGG